MSSQAMSNNFLKAGLWSSKSRNTRRKDQGGLIEGSVSRISTLSGITITYSEEYSASQALPGCVHLLASNWSVDGVDLVDVNDGFKETMAQRLPAAFCEVDYGDLVVVQH